MIKNITVFFLMSIKKKQNIYKNSNFIFEMTTVITVERCTLYKNVRGAYKLKYLEFITRLSH